MFKYKIGVFKTPAHPLSIDDLKIIYNGANQCEKLIINLIINKNDTIDYKQRFQWIYTLTKHLPNVEINNDLPIAEIIYESPKNKIHKNPFKYWNQIPNIIKPYYVKKILIIGNESTGKTVMAKSLANLYNTNCVLEYSRDVCTNCGGEDYMLEKDFEEILFQHKLNIENNCKSSNKLLFIDTDAFMTYYYRNQCFNNTNKLLSDEKIIQKISNNYDLVLFMESDVPYVQDNLRIENRNINGLRESSTKTIKELYLRNNIKFEIINGSYEERLNKAIKIINKIII